MKKTHFEHSHMRKHLDESISHSIGGDDFSNAVGRGGGGGGMRGGGGMPRGGGGGMPRTSWAGSYHGSTPRQHTNYVRRNYYGGGWGWGWGYPYAIGTYPETAYFFDVDNPKKIVITKEGLKFLKKNPKGVNGFFLNEIKNGSTFNEATLKDTLQIKDFNRVMSWMHGNKFIDFV